ncbi:beta-lactamase/transpeptidase-like protein [Aspergillus avenaceus]|uniref:Beta-lactamase/transpeptidase-like protein n=1 Tax=Aspergillus avenaceus TaxID=36643 RepID=A0A5N6U6W3_ASPAV|nr:beta-lactamase/transpeptidase-like protein [Aspergillus avenaceus]
MRFTTPSLVSLSLLQSALAFTPCPLLGPGFPAFSLDTNSTTISSALKELTGSLDKLYTKGNGSHGEVTPNTTSFSLSLFSTNKGSAADRPVFYDYHYTAPSAKSAVDKDSVYRVGGLTQIFTVWSLLIEVGDGIFNDPVTKYLPELANVHGKDALKYVNWEDVTVGQLASHMGGLARGYCIAESNSPSTAGCLPKNATKAETLAHIAHQTPVAPPGVTPIYSDAGYELLSFILERITGKSYESILKKDILSPLSLSESTLDTSIKESPSLGLYSSITDLSKAGKAILNSTLLPNPQTNRWLKPVTHTSNPANSLGYPWIIYTTGHYPNTSMVDIYTYYSFVDKYSSYIGLVPDFDVGFAILAEDTDAAADLNAHADIIGDVILTALIGTATKQAGANFRGDYVGGSNGTSISVDVDDLPGIFIEEFIVNGTDFRKTLAKLNGIQDPEALSIRLYPTGLVAPAGDKQRVSFRAIFQDKNELADAGTPTCVSWLDVDKLKARGVAMDEFVFVVDGQTAVGVEIPALKVSLERELP